MKATIYFLICICLINLSLEDCFTENPSAVSECESKKRSGYKCCYVEYRTNLVAEYKSVCVEVNNSLIKDGLHEQTIKNIESGNFTSSGWDETVLAKFRDYASIDKFDCKGNYISKLFIFSCFLILLLLK